jgi:hypothetical protein
VVRPGALAALAVLLLAAGAANATAEPRGLRLGLASDTFLSSDPGIRAGWGARAQRAGASLVSLHTNWSAIAPRARPPGFEAADPAEPAYDWGTLDAAVRDAARLGLEPVLAINRAPAWAEGPNRPDPGPGEFEPPPGTWLPQPRQLGRFAHALAARYSGSYVDPAGPGGGPLPRVGYFKIWAEQNLSLNLNPLWQGRKAVAPRHYRAMLNAAYAAVHRASPAARVIVGGLAPYGDREPGGHRIQPVRFWRAMLCLRGARLRPVECPNPARFDIAAHNPINVWGPARGATNPLDVSTPNVRRLTRIVRRAVRTGHALPARRKPFWATEIWWDSRPPDPDGVSLRRHARFLAHSLFVLWRQGVSAVVWWYLRDQDPGAAGFGSTQQSGLFFRDGRPKPAYRAFRFPFVAGRGLHGRVLLWGKAPRAGRLLVERRTRRGWAPLARPLAGRERVFLARVRAARPLLLRARQDRRVSLPWRVR